VFNLTEGSATITNAVVATFSDPGNPLGTAEDADDYSATINWGDGNVTANATIVNNGDGTWSVKGSHSYGGDTISGQSEGAADITVTISHDATTDQIVHDTANVTDPNVSATGGVVFNLTEGSATINNQVVATFSDPGNPLGTAEDAGDYSATINWGDGNVTANAPIVNNGNGTWSVTGSHTYTRHSTSGQSEGAADITVIISHDATTDQI